MMRGFSQFNDSTSHEFNNNSLQKPFVANGINNATSDSNYVSINKKSTSAYTVQKDPYFTPNNDLKSLSTISEQKDVVGKDLAMSQQQNYSNDIEEADTENNYIYKMKYQPDKMDEEAVVEIKRAHDKGKKRTVKKKVQRKRSKRPSEKRKKKGHANNNKTIAKKVNSSNVLTHKEITTYENVIAGSNLSPGTVVLVVGGTQIETGEYIRMCPFCCALEFAMIEAEIQYQIIRTDMFCGDNKPKWFKNVHPEAKPAVPCLYSDGKWIFDTINIINELKRLQKDTSKDKILSYTEGYDKFSAMTVVKYAGSADNSEEESSTRAELMSLLQPYIDRLKTNKYLGGDSLSYSDCFFSQQMCSIGVIVKVLKGSDMMESIPELSSYLKRLKMRDSWKFVRGAWEIRHTEHDVKLVEYEFGKCFCITPSSMGLTNGKYDRVTSFTNEAISSPNSLTTHLAAGSTISVQDVPKYEKDHLILVTGGIYVSSGELVKFVLQFYR